MLHYCIIYQRYPGNETEKTASQINSNISVEENLFNSTKQYIFYPNLLRFTNIKETNIASQIYCYALQKVINKFLKTKKPWMLFPWSSSV